MISGSSVRCYQCGSDEDGEYEDNCGAYRKFDTREHIAVECNSEESHMPGSFCMKITQQSPRGFICKYYCSNYWLLVFMSTKCDLQYETLRSDQLVTDCWKWDCIRYNIIATNVIR